MDVSEMFTFLPLPLTDLPTQLVKTNCLRYNLFFEVLWCIAEKYHIMYSSIHITCTDSASIGLGEMYLRCLKFLMKDCSSFCLPLLPLFLFHHTA